MPRPCAVEFHVGGYNSNCSPEDATGLVPWSLTLSAIVAVNVRLHGTSPVASRNRAALCSGERETPRDKPVASRNRAALCSGEREAPRDMPVASRAVWLRLIFKDHKPTAKFKAPRCGGGICEIDLESRSHIFSER